MAKRTEKTRPPEPTHFIDSYLTERERSEREVDRIAFDIFCILVIAAPIVGVLVALYVIYVYAPY